MKKSIAFVMTLAMLSTMFTACGGKTENKDTSSTPNVSVEEATNGEKETNTETEAETEAETEVIATSAGLLDGITFADTPSFVVTDHDVEIGDWEGYIEKFEMPANIAVSVKIPETENDGMVFGLADGTTMFRLNINAPASMLNNSETENSFDEDVPTESVFEEDSEEKDSDETAEEKETEAESTVEETKAEEANTTPVPISYTLYATEDTIYTYMSVDGAVDAKKGSTSADDESDESVDEALSSYDASKNTFAFKEYANKETIDGKDYDVIICTMAQAEDKKDVDAKLYFDENGGFYMLSYEQEGGTAEIKEIKSIDIPDVAFAETDAAELSMSLLSMIFTFAFSSTADAMEEETTEAATEDEPAEVEEETTISEEATASEE